MILICLMPPRSHIARHSPAPRSEILRQWIADGAEWGKHWAFRKTSFGPGHRVQKSIHRRGGFPKALQRGTGAFARSDRGRWIRRLSLDLTGSRLATTKSTLLFADGLADAYEKLGLGCCVQSTTASEWAWPWLDAGPLRPTQAASKVTPNGQLGPGVIGSVDCTQ